MINNTVPVYYTVQEVAEILRLHENTILKMLAEGKVKGIKVGKSWRIPAENLPKTD